MLGNVAAAASSATLHDRPAINAVQPGLNARGYSGKKPLKWITPGRVKSRNRGRPSGPAKGRSARASSDSVSTSSNSNLNKDSHNTPGLAPAAPVMPDCMASATTAASTAALDSSSSATWSPRTDSLDEPIGSPRDVLLDDPCAVIFQQAPTGHLVDPMLFTKALGSETRDFVNAILYCRF